MESDNDTGADAPIRLVTVNQIVAWNIAWLRREAGLTQQELADKLGWPQNKISEAERSWSGKRTREFNAEELIAFSLAFDVPLNALFLPPLGDGKEGVYLIRPPGQKESLGMGVLLGAVLFGDPEDASDGVTAYRRRLLAVVAEHFGPGWREEVARWLRDSAGADELRELAFHMRGDRARLEVGVDLLGEWADALEKTADERDVQ
jgi:transcriptional regulator with XRE-family HTH domain